jgi:hypothetical protein
MATQDLVVHQGGAVATTGALGISDVQRVGNLLAASGYFADAREMAQAAVKVMAGQELGIPPVAAMMGINIIKGKVALGGNLIAAQIKKHGYDFKHVRFDEKGCVLRFLSKPDVSGKREVLGDSSFTEEDAKTAGVFGDMYKKYPRNMYFNRAISNGAKWYTPDVFNGVPPYTPEELGARVDSEGEMIHEAGSSHAQADVAERKLVESGMPPEQAKAEADKHPGRKKATPKSSGDGWTTERVARFHGCMNAMKQVLGEKTYRRVLGNAGYENRIDLMNAGYATALEVYNGPLSEALRDMNLNVSEADLPDMATVYPD